MLVMQVDKFFGAGCKSPLAVKSATRAKRLTRCDSGTNSIVWMKEEIVRRLTAGREFFPLTAVSDDDRAPDLWIRVFCFPVCISWGSFPDFYFRGSLKSRAFHDCFF